jgi:hypothetical protein
MNYEELEQENKILKAKLNHIKEYKQTYFQNVQHYKTFYCKCCDKTIKYNSVWNHNSSKKHLKKKESENIQLDELNIVVNQIDTELDEFYTNIDGEKKSLTELRILLPITIGEKI